MSLTNANEIDRHNNHNNSNQPKIYMELSHASPSPLNKENSDNVGDNDIEHTGTSVSMTEASVVVSNDNSKSITSMKKIAKNKIKVASAVTALFVAFSTLIACSGKGAWRYYLAGGICAAISHAITTPVDVIKVRITTFSFLVAWLCNSNLNFISIEQFNFTKTIHSFLDKNKHHINVFNISPSDTKTN